MRGGLIPKIRSSDMVCCYTYICPKDSASLISTSKLPVRVHRDGNEVLIQVRKVIDDDWSDDDDDRVFGSSHFG